MLCFYIHLIIFFLKTGIQLDRNQGIIKSFYIKKDKIIFELFSSNSNIKNIYVFSKKLPLSERFFYDPVYVFKLQEKIFRIIIKLVF